MKRTLRIYDEWLASTFTTPIKPTAGHLVGLSRVQMRETLMAARIFQPSQHAVEYIAEAATVASKHLSELLPLARLPFHGIWIEDDTIARLRTYERLGSLAEPLDLDMTVRVGFLMMRETETRWRCHPLSVAPDHGCYRFGYDWVVDTEHYVAPYNTDEELADKIEVKGMERDRVPSNDVLSMMALGYTTGPEVRDWLKREGRSDLGKLLPHVKVDFSTPMQVEGGKYAVDAMHDLAELAGAARYLIGFLATINLVETAYTPLPAKTSRLIMGRRSIPYMTSTMVSIKIPTKPLHKIARATVKGWHNRAHEVRAHWRKHLDLDSGETIKLWVHEHYRGDASLGYVRHQYSVERIHE